MNSIHLNNITIDGQTGSAMGGLVAGDYVLLAMTGKDSSTGSDDHGCDISGCRGETAKILSVNGNTATVTTALHFPYDVYHTSSCDANCSEGVGAAKLTSTVIGLSIHDLIFDGSGTAFNGLQPYETVDSTFSNLTMQNFIGGGAYSWIGWNMSWSNITISHVANNSGGNAFTMFYQGNPSIDGLTSSNLNRTIAFGLAICSSANGTFTNISMDNAGTTGGRVVKLSANSCRPCLDNRN